MDIQERMTELAMLGATWVMWLLVIVSVVSIAIILERGVHFLRSRDESLFAPADRGGLLGLLHRGRLAEARERLRRSRASEASVVYAALAVDHDSNEAAEQRMAAESELTRLRMEKRLAFLGTVGNNAPFVGLLGTVIGVIGAFHELDASQGRVTAGLMSEIGEALVATAIGLLVALPAVLFFNLFQRTIRARLGRAEALARQALASRLGVDPAE